MLRRDAVEACVDTLRDAGLDRAGTTLVVAVSGGADSMALLHIMAQMASRKGLLLHVVHVNHGIRTDAGLDQEVVEHACRTYGLSFACEKVETPAAAEVSGASIEIEARNLRYLCFAKHYLAQQADALLTAHNRGDQAETVLLNLARGCSPAALSGIPEDTTRLGMRIVRPLLSCNRGQIVGYLEAHGHTWREDSTNTDLAYRRNAVRHIILPAMRKHLNPRIEDALLRCAAMAHEDEAFLQAMAQEHAALIFPSNLQQNIMLEAYRQTPKPLRTRLLVDWLWRVVQLKPGSLSYDTIQRIDEFALHSTAGEQVSLPSGHRLQHAYDRLVLLSGSAQKATSSHVPLSVPGTTPIPEYGCQITIDSDQGFERQPPQKPGSIPATCHIRLPHEGEHLLIRNRLEGDRIEMTGPGGHRKLQDILTDLKVPVCERDQIPLLVSGNDIIWIPGLRVSHDWAVPAPDAPSLRITIAPLRTSQ